MKIKKITTTEIKNLIKKEFEIYLTESDINTFLEQLNAEIKQNNKETNNTNKPKTKNATKKPNQNQTPKSKKKLKQQLPIEIQNSASFVKTNKTVKGFIGSVSKFMHHQITQDVEFINSSDPASSGKADIKNAPSNALIATLYYRINNYFYYIGKTTKNKKLTNQSKKLSQLALSQTGIDIHPGAEIETPLFIDHGYGVVIGETANVGKNCMLFNGVVLGSKSVQNTAKTKRHPTLKNGVIVCAGAKILGDIVLGDNVFVSPNAVVIDNIEPDHQVLIVNQLQIKKRTTNTYLPSQQVVVYGVVPKFKNSISILGEGFYNPKVLIKLRNKKELNYQISYWDKNKIIIKFKHSTPLEKADVKGVRIIVFSNSHKVVVLSNAGLEKALTSFSG